jgi:hypothetical protein
MMHFPQYSVQSSPAKAGNPAIRDGLDLEERRGFAGCPAFAGHREL